MNVGKATGRAITTGGRGRDVGAALYRDGKPHLRQGIEQLVDRALGDLVRQRPARTRVWPCAPRQMRSVVGVGSVADRGVVVAARHADDDRLVRWQPDPVAATTAPTIVNEDTSRTARPTLGSNFQPQGAIDNLIVSSAVAPAAG